MIVEIPFKTPTVNHLYWHRGNIKILKKPAKECREEIIELVKNCNYVLNDYLCEKLKVTVEIYENWYYKTTGEVARRDIANREKFLVDSVFEALDIDDKMIFSLTMIKHQSMTEEKAIITVEVL